MKLLADKLPDVLNEKQKADKIRNYLTILRQEGMIERTDENQLTGAWRLAKKD
jgi:ATP-dependent DNA helicase RecG